MREKAVSRSREHSKDVALCGLFAALVAVGAFIKVVIPTGADTMNFTLQWFFVMLAAFLLGSRRAFTSVGVYLLIGLAGVPIFARGGGPAYLLRPTFGFLLGFLLAAWVMGKVCECLNSWKMGALMTAATGKRCIPIRGFRPQETSCIVCRRKERRHTSTFQRQRRKVHMQSARYIIAGVRSLQMRSVGNL